MMKAARIHKYGAAPVMDEVPVPDAGPDEVLVRIKAASLNPLDNKLQSGAMHGFFLLAFPYVIGTDLAGTVERAGSDVTRWQAGDKVVARLDPTKGGALAEFAVLPASYLAAAPATVPLEETAGIPTAASTAWQALFEVAGLKSGQTILVHAGAGGVGSFAIQLAHATGARVIATASGAGLEIARRLGADQVIDYKAEDFAAKVSGLDVVLDTIGGETQVRSFGILKAGGALVTTVSPPDEALAKAHGVTATFVFHQSDASRLEKIVDRLDAGALKVLVDRTVPLADFADAFAYQASGRARGKIILALP
jgi:NADPH:quinone reductase-like Zn-dependent oxidoreductase